MPTYEKKKISKEDLELNYEVLDLDNCHLKPATYADDCEIEKTDICLQTAGLNCNQP